MKVFSFISMHTHLHTFTQHLSAVFTTGDTLIHSNRSHTWFFFSIVMSIGCSMKYPALCIIEPLRAVKQYIKIYSVLFFFQFPKGNISHRDHQGFYIPHQTFYEHTICYVCLTWNRIHALWLKKVKNYPPVDPDFPFSYTALH